MTNRLQLQEELGGRKAESMLYDENLLLYQSFYFGERTLTCRCADFIPDGGDTFTLPLIFFDVMVDMLTFTPLSQHKADVKICRSRVYSQINKITVF